MKTGKLDRLVSPTMIPAIRSYPVSEKARRPLVDFMTDALRDAGCSIVHQSSPDRAPFTVVFQTALGERIGIVAYAFLATRTPTRNRPDDERSFQIKYGSREAYGEENVHELWQDPMGMFTTLLVGIDPDEGFCVSADAAIHNPTKFFIRLEFKDKHADAINRNGWFSWERIKRNAPYDSPKIETIVGATKNRFLDLVRFERAAKGVSPGNRLILAEHHALSLQRNVLSVRENTDVDGATRAATDHPLVRQFHLSAEEILDLIAGARRLKMAVRGWVAEEHLRTALSRTPNITHCERSDDEGGPDLRVSYRDAPLLTIECKNVARECDKYGNPKIDFQRTRASKANPCSRYYQVSDFDVVAACLHAVTAAWDFRYTLPSSIPAHVKCVGRLTNNVKIDQSWSENVAEILTRAYAIKGIAV